MSDVSRITDAMQERDKRFAAWLAEQKSRWPELPEALLKEAFNMGFKDGGEVALTFVFQSMGINV